MVAKSLTGRGASHCPVCWGQQLLVEHPGLQADPATQTQTAAFGMCVPQLPFSTSPC